MFKVLILDLVVTNRLFLNLYTIMKTSFLFPILVILLYISTGILAQQTITITGTVKSNPDVNIVLPGTDYGTTTDKDGEYSLKVFYDENPIQLHFSSVGFRDTIIQIDYDINLPDTVHLNISLKETSYQLQEINIEAFSDFYRINDGVIVDIGFLDSYLIALISKKKKSEIVVLNEYGGLLLKHRFNNKYNAIYKDCFMNLGLVGKDSCLQFYYNVEDTTFHLIDKFSTEVFNNKLKPCLFKFDCMFLFKEYFHDKNNTFVSKYHNKRIDYYYVNICDSVKKKDILNSFFDEKAFMIASSYYSEIISLYYRTTPENQNIIAAGIWDGNILKLINDDHELFNLISWYLKVEATSIKVEVFRKNDELLFLNLSNQTILKYNPNFELLDTITFTNLRDKAIITSVLQDRKSENIYSKVIKNGIYYLSDINTMTGSVSGMVQTNSEPFPKLFKVSNNYSYSVYYDAQSRLSRIVRITLIK